MGSASLTREPVGALQRIAFLLEREQQPTYRVKAFRNAAAAIAGLPAGELERLTGSGRLRDLPGIGETTERVVLEAMAGDIPAYLAHLEGEPSAVPRLAGRAQELFGALKGDCHMHSDWSDGGSPIQEMAETACAHGHDWTVLTDHSPRLTVANGLTPERLRRQLEVVAELNEGLAPFRLLTGIEVDILADGGLDQEPQLLEQLDVVVASVHSKLRMERGEMTRRMLLAVANPHVDVLGHCTGRLVVGKGRPESEFDADLVFAACIRFDKALEVNSRPERLDPPRRLLSRAIEMGCKLAVDTDAHAPGQLEWQAYGCERAAECGADSDLVVNTWDADRLLAWAASHPA
ncbi:MAG: PHP domain-containing protein [Acidimicrobiia bacterium]